MPKGRPKKEIIPEESFEKPIEKAPLGFEQDKIQLLELYQTLLDLKIRSISDLENLIAKAE